MVERVKLVLKLLMSYVEDKRRAGLMYASTGSKSLIPPSPVAFIPPDFTTKVTLVPAMKSLKSVKLLFRETALQHKEGILMFNGEVKTSRISDVIDYNLFKNIY